MQAVRGEPPYVEICVVDNHFPLKPWKPVWLDECDLDSSGIQKGAGQRGYAYACGAARHATEEGASASDRSSNQAQSRVCN